MPQINEREPDSSQAFCGNVLQLQEILLMDMGKVKEKPSTIHPVVRFREWAEAIPTPHQGNTPRSLRLCHCPP